MYSWKFGSFQITLSFIMQECPFTKLESNSKLNIQLANYLSNSLQESFQVSNIFVQDYKQVTIWPKVASIQATLHFLYPNPILSNENLQYFLFEFPSKFSWSIFKPFLLIQAFLLSSILAIICNSWNKREEIIVSNLIQS